MEATDPNGPEFSSLDCQKNSVRSYIQPLSRFGYGHKVFNWLASGHLRDKGNTKTGHGQENCGMSRLSDE